MLNNTTHDTIKLFRLQHACWPIYYPGMLSFLRVYQGSYLIRRSANGIPLTLLQTPRTVFFLAIIMAHPSDLDNFLQRLMLEVKSLHTGTNGPTPLGCAYPSTMGYPVFTLCQPVMVYMASCSGACASATPSDLSWVSDKYS